MGVRPGGLAGNILVVDDGLTKHMVLMAMLGKRGGHCDFVADGQQAAVAMSPDLIAGLPDAGS